MKARIVEFEDGKFGVEVRKKINTFFMKVPALYLDMYELENDNFIYLRPGYSSFKNCKGSLDLCNWALEYYNKEMDSINVKVKRYV